MNPNYEPTKKPESIPKLKAKLWKEFSIFIRRREADADGYTKCFTCGKRDHWKNLDAGHYIAKNIGGANLYFHEKNVWPQCTHCNRFLHGNQHQYAMRLQARFGNQILEWLEAYRKGSVQYNAGELMVLIKYYKNINAKNSSKH